MLDTLKVQRDFILDPSLLLYLPLYELDGKKFMSKDAYGHLCTVTGALWRPNGREFDGDDYISLPAGAGLTPEEGTIIIWMKFSRDDANEYLFSSNGDEISIYHTSGNLIRLYYDAQLTVSWTVASAVGNAVHLAFTFKKSGTSRGYEDAVEKNSAACSATAPTGATPKIGTVSSTAGGFLVARIMEFLEYNRQLTGREISRHRLRTMWRYQ